MLHVPKVKPVVEDTPATRLILLDRGVRSLEEIVGADAAGALRATIQEQVSYTVELGYEHLSAQEVLQRLLPEGVQPPTSFETVGHIIHLNLREEHSPHKHLIGTVLLDKYAPRVRTVVNKVDSISNEFRVFPMEVLAGESTLVTRVKENGCTYDLDYGQVYWNSRLEAEHRRLVDSMDPESVLVDLMAGIGPFAIPAARRGMQVLANDLNPACYEFLLRNVQVNRVERAVAATNMDARAFWRDVKASGKLQAAGAPVHAVLNLPATALEFLDVFRDHEGFPLCLHCYCFSSAADVTADVTERGSQALGADLRGRSSVRVVRDVAPSKLMLCLEFELPAAGGDPVALAHHGTAAAEGRGSPSPASADMEGATPAAPPAGAPGGAEEVDDDHIAGDAGRRVGDKRPRAAPE